MWENRNDDINGIKKVRIEKDKEDGKLPQHTAYEEVEKKRDKTTI